MLSELSIQNIALIDKAVISFKNGLNVLSGETGSGKSVIIDSLNFVLGAKADKNMIRYGEKEGLVSAVFEIEEDEPIHQILKEYDIDDDVIVIRRKLDISGKSEMKINGETMSVAMARKITGHLVDLHGQSEHYILVKEANQLALIDKLNPEISPLLEKCAELNTRYKKVLSELDNLGGNSENRAIRIDILQYQINEIKNADIKEFEEEELRAKREKINNQEKISAAIMSAAQSLNGEGCALDTLQNAHSAMSKIRDFDGEYENIYNRLDSALSELDDITSIITSFAEESEYSAEDADEVEERLELIKKIKKKYGQDYYKINEFLENAEEELEKLNNYDNLADKYLKEKSLLEKEIYKNFTDLHNLRIKTADSFSNRILSELRELGMKSAMFAVEFYPEPSPEETEYTLSKGFDRLKFMFSANKGEPLKPLSDIISGGELSRFMLAIKAQTAKYQDINSFVFDEIDVGISGNTAHTVAEKLAKISKDRQIIAISHLPQIASMADCSILISKTETENKTNTNVKVLDKESKIKEIARLVGGISESESALKLAREMIEKCDNYKNTL